MKLSSAVLFFVASAEDEKVPSEHPLQLLDRLTDFSAELLNTWYSWLQSKDAWIRKFETNAGRMERNFKRGEQRCGHYNEFNLPHGGQSNDRIRRDFAEHYNTDDPAVGTKQVISGFRKWTERYLAACSGQKVHKYQVERMRKWNEKLQAHLAAYYKNEPTTYDKWIIYSGANCVNEWDFISGLTRDSGVKNIEDCVKYCESGTGCRELLLLFIL